MSLCWGENIDNGNIVKAGGFSLTNEEKIGVTIDIFHYGISRFFEVL